MKAGCKVAALGEEGCCPQSLFLEEVYADAACTVR